MEVQMLIADATRDDWGSKADSNGGAYYWQDAGAPDGWHNIIMRQGDTKMSLIIAASGTIKDATTSFANSNPATRIIVSGIFQDAGGTNDLMGDVVIDHK